MAICSRYDTSDTKPIRQTYLLRSVSMLTYCNSIEYHDTLLIRRGPKRERIVSLSFLGVPTDTIRRSKLLKSVQGVLSRLVGVGR